MSDVLISNVVSIFVLLLLYVSFLLTPKLTRKDLIFGVFIPLDRSKDEEIRKVAKTYYSQLTVFSIVFIALYMVALNTIFKNSILLLIAVLVELAIYFIIFLSANKKIKEYKSKNNLLKDKKQILYVNTEMSQKLRNKTVLSSYWFAIPMIIAIINLVLPIMNYDKLPGKIGVHFNLYGVADRFAEKSIGTLVTNGAMEIILVFILAFANYSIAISKNKIDASKPSNSANQLYKFKKFNSIMIYSLAVVITFFITFFNLSSLNIISVNLRAAAPIIITVFLIITILPTVLSLMIGQGGSNLKETVNEETDNSVTNVDDDEYWKLGSIYYNPNDPSVFVEKRFGIGWTLNFGNKTALAITIGFVILMIALIVVPMIFF
ncbi:DUF1648 domain-containing protein [Clostridium manihotivorum]|uniref:DUF1648 domain-containing protein n=1 Tax=Clostridium manihotivorum TaxID=2320868 RepID=A0A3R5QXB8_9CLOT|nr:DUF5808 domain-containing protein [Clostridium manihotivorum]QAA34440.1 hypothetical protein C1I91_23920 [Clostridium manihotivorum]